MVLVLSDVVFRGYGLDFPRKVAYDSFLLGGKIWALQAEPLVPSADMETAVHECWANTHPSFGIRSVFIVYWRRDYGID